MSSTRGGKAVQHRDGAVGLRYIGNGAALPDVPARDLGEPELEALAETVGKDLMGHGGRASFVKLLLESTLYEVGPVAEQPVIDTPAPAPPAESE